MKKLIIILVFMGFAALSHAQAPAKTNSTELIANSSTSAATAEQLTKSATLTDMTFKIQDGTSLPVYKSSKGSLFVVRTSKKTGNAYKQYVKQK